MPQDIVLGEMGVVVDKLTLYGFNNLTKTLSFNIYDVCFTRTEREKRDYIAYIDEQYNSRRLTGILCELTEQIEATVLNISKQDYEPQGASVNLLIADQPVKEVDIDPSNNRGLDVIPRDFVHGHLDKSHVTVHTFPEAHPNAPISTFRVDIDVQTCGTISPLESLDFLIGNFDSDIMSIDYRVRGFTRDVEGKKLFHDKTLRSIQDSIAPETLQKYDAVDINVYQANLFHTRLMLKEIELGNYLFQVDPYELSPHQRLMMLDTLKREMLEIYSGVNIYD